MSVAIVKPSLAEVQKGIARFSELKRVTTGIPDMLLPEFNRTFLNVLGFSQPKGVGKVSPFGDTAVAKITHLKAGLGVSFVSAKPGKGVAMHIHDTVESFLFLKGKWKLEFELDKGTDYVILGPLDFIACPIGVEHRFECIEADPGEEEGLMLTIVAGDEPAAIGSPATIRHMVDAGVFTPEQAEAVLKNTGTPHW
jgi:quercetin dioxygenase-like cupin family protein